MADFGGVKSAKRLILLMESASLQRRVHKNDVRFVAKGGQAHRDMPALAGGFRRRRGGRSHGRLRLQGPRRTRFGNGCVVELGNCCQHLPPMPKRDTNVLEVLIGQMGQSSPPHRPGIEQGSLLARFVAGPEAQKRDRRASFTRSSRPLQ
jgi:hypothetical protein